MGFGLVTEFNLNFSLVQSSFKKGEVSTYNFQHCLYISHAYFYHNYF